MSQVRVTKRETCGIRKVNAARTFGKLMVSELPILFPDMPSTPHQQMAKRQWVDGAQVRLGALTEAVAALRGESASGYVTGLERIEKVASEVLGAAAALTQWLGTSRAPRGLAKAEGELGATAGVYRNAAVAFGSLAKAGSDQHQARCAAGAKLLDQGDHHVEMYVSILQKRGLTL
jgi:hypothetical protein